MNRTSTQKRCSAPVGGLTQLSSPKTSATVEAGSKKCRSYKPLPTQFEHGGFDYRQIARQRDFAIYKQTWKGNERAVAFEVIRIRKRESFVIGGKFVAGAEVYPKAKDWGTDGWTVLSRDIAFEKLREICR